MENTEKTERAPGEMSGEKPGSIRILPSQLINQIAAGEVIERPASIVKELVENSLDAKSSHIDISLREGGLAAITVADDGIGMTKEDLCLSIQRHATSKLLGNNLLDIHSFGFRGEAIPSICSIARVSIQSKMAGSSSGWNLKIEGGEVRNLTPTVCKNGTIFSVSDIFYTTPVRLKFLRSPSTELSYIQQTVKMLALANFAVGMTLTCDKKTIEYPVSPTLEGRIQHILTNPIFENGVMFQRKGKQEGWGLEGWLGLPTLRTKNINYCFINNRPVKDRLLLAAIRAAYQNVLIPGEQPSFVLYLTVPVEEVDMNVHPTKAEVRFRHPAMIRPFIIRTLEEVLEQASMHTAQVTTETFPLTLPEALSERKKSDWSWSSFDLSSFSKSEDRKLSEGSSFVSPISSEIFSFSDNGFKPDPKPTETDFAANKAEPFTMCEEPKDKSDLPPLDGTSEGKERGALKLGEAKVQLFSSFILSVSENSFFLIDQHAAAERITYENLEKCIFFDEQGNIVSKLPVQKLLLPEQVDFMDVAILQEYLPDIEKLGFKIKVHEASITILEIPLIFKDVSNIVALLQTVLHEITENGLGLSFLQKVHKIFADFACHRSLRANHPLSLEEMNALLRQIESTPRSGQCNHGRPVYVEISQKQLAHFFERTN